MDFQIRRLFKFRKYEDRIILASPCKHLIHIIKFYESNNFKLKIYNDSGPKVCSEKLRDELLKEANYQCTISNCLCKNYLEIHRLIRGSNGGKYIKKNCRVLCKYHHNLVT